MTTPAFERMLDALAANLLRSFDEQTNHVLAQARALDRICVDDSENEPPDFEVDDGFEI